MLDDQYIVYICIIVHLQVYRYCVEVRDESSADLKAMRPTVSEPPCHPHTGTGDSSQVM